MRQMLRELFTGADNATHDIVRWLAGLGGLQGLALQVWDVVGLHNHFDIQAFGIGLGSMLAGVGAALMLKKDTEPKP